MHFGAHILSGMLRASVICRLAVKEKYFVITTCRTAHDFVNAHSRVLTYYQVCSVHSSERFLVLHQFSVVIFKSLFEMKTVGCMHFGAHILSGMLRASVICRLAVKKNTS